MPEKITPTCRYGHGELHSVTGGGTSLEWSILSPTQNGMAYHVMVFMCPSCGYVELFDSEPAITMKQETKK